MSKEKIVVQGARVHNLKNITVEIPVTAWWSLPGYPVPANLRWLFDTIYAEGAAAVRGIPLRLRPAVPGPDGQAGCGQYRRAFPGHLHRPEDHLEQPRSTVGTVTEIYDYLRLLYARVGHPTVPIAAWRLSARP